MDNEFIGAAPRRRLDYEVLFVRRRFRNDFDLDRNNPIGGVALAVRMRVVGLPAHRPIDSATSQRVFPHAFRRPNRLPKPPRKRPLRLAEKPCLTPALAISGADLNPLDGRLSAP